MSVQIQCQSPLLDEQRWLDQAAGRWWPQQPDHAIPGDEGLRTHGTRIGTTGADAEAELKRREEAAASIEDSIEKLIKGLENSLSTAYIKRAGGGWVYGPGSSTSDSVHLAASNGEYVVNAESAAAHGPLLEAINSGVRLSLPSVSRPAIQAAPVGGSSVDAVAAITAALTQMTVQVVNQFGVRESARIVSAGIGEVARNDPGQLRGAMTKAGV